METALLLEDKGAETDVKDNDGKTALDIADINGQNEMVNLCKAKSHFKLVEVC